MDPLTASRNVGEFHHIDHVEIDNVKNFQRFIVWNGAEQWSSAVNGHILNISQMTAEMFDKLDPPLLFLPEFNMAITAARYNELGSEDNKNQY